MVDAYHPQFNSIPTRSYIFPEWFKGLSVEKLKWWLFLSTYRLGTRGWMKREYATVEIWLKMDSARQSEAQAERREVKMKEQQRYVAFIFCKYSNVCGESTTAAWQYHLIIQSIPESSRKLCWQWKLEGNCFKVQLVSRIFELERMMSETSNFGNRCYPSLIDC